MLFPSRATQIEEEVQQRSLESAQEFRRRVHISVDHSDDVINDHPRDNVEILRSVRNFNSTIFNHISFILLLGCLSCHFIY